MVLGLLAFGCVSIINGGSLNLFGDGGMAEAVADAVAEAERSADTKIQLLTSQVWLVLQAFATLFKYVDFETIC